MPASEVSICNQAIGWVGGDRIISFSDGTAEANLCADNYDSIRKAVLEAAEWHFATARVVPAKSSIAPAYGYASAFPIPTDNIRILTVSSTVDDENDVDWVIEGDSILCDYDVIYVRYIKNIDDPAKFSASFVQALASRLGAEFAIPIAKSRSLQADMWKLYERKVGEASNLSGMQGKSKGIKSSWLKKARQQ